MPSPIGGVGVPDPTTANDMVSSIGFSRSYRMQETSPLNPYVTPRGAEARETSFGTIFADAVENMQNRIRKTNDLGIQAATGRLTNVHDYTVAAAESRLTIELTSTIRNKAVDAFNEIMRMQA